MQKNSKLLLSIALILGLNTPIINAQIYLNSGTTGTTTTIGQSFNETRGVDVKVISQNNIVIHSMMLSGFFSGNNGTSYAYVGARIYNSTTSALLASATDTVHNIYNGSVTVPLSFTFIPGSNYKISFYCSGPNPPTLNSARMFQPQSFPYNDASNSLQILQAYESAYDSAPDNINIYVPLITLNAITGIDPFSLNINSSVFPNPASDDAILSFENTEKEVCTVVLYNSQGQVVRIINNIKEEKVEIERQDLANGLYYFQLKTAGRVLANGKMIFK